MNGKNNSKLITRGPNAGSQLFDLHDYLNPDERRRFGIATALDMYQREMVIKAVFAGEKRPPKKGEWYLSGAIIQAYRAPNDLDTPYHIARLVRTETKTVITTDIVADKKE